MLPSLQHLLRQRRVRWILFGVAVGLAAAGAVTVELVRIKQDLDAGRAALSEIDLATIDDHGGLAAVADRAADRLDAAAERARTSPILRVLGAIPIVGTQIDAVQDMTAAVAELGGHGREAAANIDAALDAGSGPSGRLAVVRAAEIELDKLQRALDDVDLGARGWLIPPLHNARREVRIDLADARSDLARSATLARALEGFLVGPRRYLVLGGNDAEMRAVGIPTTSGIANIADGAIHVGEFSGATHGIELPEPGVPVPVEYEALYGWLNGDRGYRTTLATANWPEAAKIASDITAQNEYGPVDGIIYVDTLTLAVLLDVIGPVEVEGVEYGVDNVLEELLYRNYLRYQTVEDNPERKALQSEIAQAIFDELETRDYSVLELAGRLAELAHGRHLLAWSADEDENRLWEAFGADGRLRADGLMVVSENLNASKLDYFLQPTVDVAAEPDGDTWQVTLRVSLIHSEHGESSPYIDGGGRYADPGEYGSFLLAYLPEDANDITISTGITHYGRDGPMFVAGTILRVPEGTTKTVTIQFSLPRAQEQLSVLSSARLVGTFYSWGDEEANDSDPFTLDLRDAN